MANSLDWLGKAASPIAAIAGIGTSVYGAKKASSASKQAAQILASAARDAAASSTASTKEIAQLYRDMFAKQQAQEQQNVAMTRADQAPYRTIGQAATGNLSRLMTAPPRTLPPSPYAVAPSSLMQVMTPWGSIKLVPRPPGGR